MQSTEHTPAKINLTQVFSCTVLSRSCNVWDIDMCLQGPHKKPGDSMLLWKKTVSRNVGINQIEVVIVVVVRRIIINSRRLLVVYQRGADVSVWRDWWVNYNCSSAALTLCSIRLVITGHGNPQSVHTGGTL